MKKTSLVFTGDIGFDRYMDGKWDDEELLSPEIIDFLRSGNHVIANVEGAMVDRENNSINEGVLQLMHTMNPQAKKVLRKMNADIWNLCNNHIMDAGDEGVYSTLQHAKDFNAKTIGAGMNIDEASRPLYLDEAGGIGIFAVGFRRGCKPAGENKAGCLLWNDMAIIQRNIEEIKRKCRWCIIVAHGGEEFTSLPSPYTRERYLNYLKMGADIIVAHHPHVPMNYETVGDKMIFYSLGNFIFDTPYQRAQYNTEKGILLKLFLDEEGFSFEAMGLRINRENEHIEKSVLPKIFADVNETEYEL
ncbi:MAG: CapA family protein, partial [Erysipelotrichaceae bacterium]|nr:CapA family protein [Erysipelotrichaceae bacterium]